MSKVVIVDYELGNLFSVKQAMQNIGLDVSIANSAEGLEHADAVVLPGVGAFGDAMNSLNKSGLADGIRNFIAKGKPFMGVCLGLQLLFTESEEFGSAKGLNILKGTVKKFPNHNASGSKMKVPQIAWNEIYSRNISWENTPFASLDQNEHMYFVHSYYVEPDDKKYALSLTKYMDTEYVSSVYTKNIFACQFHPEKSAGKGLSIYKDWAVQNNLLP